MKQFEERTVQSIVAHTCDCCGREAKIGDNFEASEFIFVDYVGGYQSIFGDGAHVSIDICQYCLKEKLGAWLRITTQESLEQAD